MPKNRKKLTLKETGTVKWFNATKGYGFIEPAAGGRDIFVHITDVQAAGLGSLEEGQVLRYIVSEDRQGRPAAAALEAVASELTAQATTTTERIRGMLKSWKTGRGFGFIKRDDGDADVFLHIRQLQSANIPTPPEEGLEMSFVIRTGLNGQTFADDIMIE